MINFQIKYFEISRNYVQLCFQMLKFAVKIINLPVLFAESQPSVEFSPIMKVSFQRTEK